MNHPIWVFVLSVSTCAWAVDFSSEIVVTSIENDARSVENRSDEVPLSERSSDEASDTSYPTVRPVVTYNSPELAQFPRFDGNIKTGEPVLKYYKRYILSPRIMNPYTMAAAQRPRPFMKYYNPPYGRPIKRTFMANKPIYMPKFMYTERPPMYYNKPPQGPMYFRPLPPITAPKLNEMIISNPIRTSPEYAQLRPHGSLPAKPRIPDYIYQQPAVSPSARIPTIVRPPPGAFLLSHPHHVHQYNNPHQHPTSPVTVTQQFNPVKLSPQQPQYQSTSGTAPIPVQTTPVTIPQSHNYALPPQALVQHQKEPEYVAVPQAQASQPIHYQPVQYHVQDSAREPSQEVPHIEQNVISKQGYMKVFVPTGEQFVAMPEQAPPKYFLTTSPRVVYKAPPSHVAQQQAHTIYVTHQPQYSTLIAQGPVDSPSQYVEAQYSAGGQDQYNNQDAATTGQYQTIPQSETGYATIRQADEGTSSVPYSQPYTDYRTVGSVHNYRTAEADHLLTALRAHKVMSQSAQYPAAEQHQDIIVGTTKAADSSEQDSSGIVTDPSGSGAGIWSTLTAAVNVSSDYGGKEGKFNALVEVPAPKLSSSGA